MRYKFSKKYMDIRQDLSTKRITIREGRKNTKNFFAITVDEGAFRRAIDALWKGEFD